MGQLTSKERISRILKRLPVDRIGAYEAFWTDTRRKWVAEGHVDKSAELDDHFHLDMRQTGPFKHLEADPDFGEQIVEETEETKLVRNGSGALLRWWKNKSGTPEHVDFLVKDRAGWDQHARPLLTDPDLYERRVDLEVYRVKKEQADRQGHFFCPAVVNVFECIHPVCGHEYMLMGMALDPDWVKDMCNVYAELLINLMEIVFAEGGLPDAIWFWEDLGFKQKPFMSPAMYKEIVWPAHKRTFDYVHSKGLPVIVHSCGFVEPLIPDLIAAGMDCLQAMETKAGMDLVELKSKYGDRIAFCGGMDARTLVANDRDAIAAELERKLPAAMADSGYILHSDHSIPDQVEYETYKFFLDRGREMGTY
ncbi:MAG: hypothetical protein KAX78_06165 [Phycisphaerae bacterium]|nr:hypothetical protein [Phycisphaerae bacterium]